MRKIIKNITLIIICFCSCLCVYGRDFFIGCGSEWINPEVALLKDGKHFVSRDFFENLNLDNYDFVDCKKYVVML